MVAPLAVLRLVIDHPIHHLHLTHRVISLEVGGIIHRIPQAKFDCRKNGYVGSLGALVGEGQLPDFQVFAQRDEITDVCLDPCAGGLDGRVAHSMAALVLIQVACGWAAR